jgi:hypothetical protein
MAGDFKIKAFLSPFFLFIEIADVSIESSCRVHSHATATANGKVDSFDAAGVDLVI